MKRSVSVLTRSAIALFTMVLIWGVVLLSLTARKVSRDNYERKVMEKENAVDQTALLLDDVFYKIYRYATTVTNESALRPVSIRNKVDEIEAKNRLSAIKHVNNNILSICVYYNDLDLFISDACSYKTEYFLTSYYKFELLSPQEIKSYFTEPDFSDYYPVFVYCGNAYSANNAGDVGNCLLMVTPLPYWNGNPYGTLGLLLDTTQILNQLSLVAGNGIARIVKDSGEVMIAANFTDSAADGEHSFTKHSSYFDFYYEVLVEESELSQYSIFSNKLVGILLLICLLFGFCVFFTAKWISRPISQLVRRISMNSKPVGDDFSLLQSYIYDLSQRVEQNQIYSDELRIRRLLSGHGLSQADLALCETEFKGDYSVCYVFLARFDCSAEGVRHLTMIEAEHALIHLLRWNASNVLLGVIATDKEIAEQIKSIAMPEQLKPHLTVCGIGTEDITLLPDSLSTAENLFNNLVYRNRNGFFYADDEGMTRSIYPTNELYALRHALDTRSPSQLIEAGRMIEKALQSPSMSIDCASMVAFELSAIFQDIRDSIGNVDEFCEVLQSAINRKSQEFTEQQSAEKSTDMSGANDDFTGRVSAFIAAHLYDQNFGISFTAQAFDMTDSAFSHAFKRAFKENYINYVNQLRIDDAKKLLAEEESSIDEVARQLGYSSSSNFCRMFKSLTGMTPGAFKRGGE